MTSRVAVSTTSAAAPLPVYSQAIKSKGMVYVSGNIGLDPSTRTLVEGGIKAQTTRTLDNIEAILKAAGSDLGKVQKLNVYIKTFDDFAAMNEVYFERFADPKPARTCVAVVDLPLGAIVEMECVAEYE